MTEGRIARIEEIIDKLSAELKQEGWSVTNTDSKTFVRYEKQVPTGKLEVYLGKNLMDDRRGELNSIYTHIQCNLPKDAKEPGCLSILPDEAVFEVLNWRAERQLCYSHNLDGIRLTDNKVQVGGVIGFYDAAVPVMNKDNLRATLSTFMHIVGKYVDMQISVHQNTNFLANLPPYKDPNSKKIKQLPSLPNSS